MRSYPNQLMNSLQEVSYLSYNDYIREKGFFFFSLSNLKDSHFISKVGNILTIGDNKYYLKYTPVLEVLKLIHEYDSSIKIELNSNIEINLLDNLSGLFIADFSTDKVLLKDIYVSPILKSVYEDHTDSFNSKYKLVSFEVYTKYTKRKVKITNNDKEYITNQLNNDSEAYIKYKATALNVYGLHEIPLQDIGLDGVVSMGGYKSEGD